MGINDGRSLPKLSICSASPTQLNHHRLHQPLPLKIFITSSVKMRTQFLTFVLSATLAFASPTTWSNQRRDVEAALAPSSANSLENFFAIIENIPTPVLEAGDVALSEYLATTPAANLEKTESVQAREVAAQAGIIDDLKCAASIAELIISTVVPAARLLRIKKYIEALGGSGKVIKILIKLKKGEKVGSAEVLDAAKKLIKEITGIDDIQKKCKGVIF